MANLRILIVFYSRTGTTRLVAQDLKEKLASAGHFVQLEDLIDLKNRHGVLGWLNAGRDASTKKLTQISKPSINPHKFNLVILGTPVWAAKMACALRTYIADHRNFFKKVAFFGTMGANDSEKLFDDMTSECYKNSLANLYLLTKEVMKKDKDEQLKNTYDSKINLFVKTINKIKNEKNKEK
ncbi:hypothetical protein HN587_01465 [Candidatus Woesearchaeota archaeon]|jgi:menaquinone-dependent protoporphyrinogen IX oxidase|nr:hypothetical protein [Candidatus Woesearchaeota archaeon]